MIDEPLRERGIYVVSLVCALVVFVGGDAVSLVMGESVQLTRFLVNLAAGMAAGVGSGWFIIIGLRKLATDREEDERTSDGL